MRYTYKDFVTGKLHYTRGIFEQWSQPTGPLNVRYAIFKTPRTRVCVPWYCLTRETRARLAELEATQDLTIPKE
jgi:hypothetical protein